MIAWKTGVWGNTGKALGGDNGAARGGAGARAGASKGAAKCNLVSRFEHEPAARLLWGGLVTTPITLGKEETSWEQIARARMEPLNSMFLGFLGRRGPSTPHACGGGVPGASHV